MRRACTPCVVDKLVLVPVKGAPHFGDLIELVPRDDVVVPRQVALGLAWQAEGGGRNRRRRLCGRRRSSLEAEKRDDGADG